MKLFFSFIRDIYENKSVIYQLTKRDYKNRYIGSFLGFIWTIIQPIVLILVLWVVFTWGFKVREVDGGFPFIAWLTVGIIAWNFFAEVLAGSTSVFQEYSYLVKKLNFRIAVLPIVKLLSSFITHVIFILIAMILLVIYDVSFSIYWFQVLYYLFAMMVLLLGLSWITSCLQVFVNDVAQIVSIVLQFGFWLTPIFWSFDMLPENLRRWFELNPMFYIVNGYRESFLYDVPFWENLGLVLYFWGFTLVVLIIGVILFRKLRPHFADVL